ncbi:hypothetical protein FDECE_16439 [Fusarium decemcellulare]|nr:hypothetical protein FDECE_16439 [Fusarium decemcellulare]
MSLKARVSLDAQRVIKESFQDLERTLSTNDRVSLDSTTLDDVREAIVQVQDGLKARGVYRNMRRLMPLLTGLQYYSQAIEVLCNGTPYLPWVWAPIKLVLKVASEYVEAFEKIIKAYSRIAEPLARFEMFDRSFAGNKDVQQTLAVFYSDILSFHKEAYRFVRRSGWRLLFLTSWGRFQRKFDGIIEDLKAHEDLVDKTTNAVNITEAREMRDKLKLWREESQTQLAKDEAERTAAQYRAVVGWLNFDDSNQHKVFDTIASEAQKSPGTCSWILQQRQVQAWLRCNSEMTFVVLQGGPGTGKSVLASQIVNFLRSSEQSLVISHFCTYSYEESLDYEQILRSILIQIIRPNTDLVAHVYDTLVLKKRVPTNQALEGLLRDVFGVGSSKSEYIHLVLDGLDECQKSAQPRVVKILERVVSAAFSSGSTVCKVLLFSRAAQVGLKKGNSKRTICLSDEKNSMTQAIEQYATLRLAELRPRLAQMRIDDADMKRLEAQIASKADGMFLWARLVLEYLENNMFFGREEILRVTDALPQELGAFYRQILAHSTARFSELSIQRARSILGWIAFAERPLRKAEFRSALAFSSGNPDVDELPPPYLFDMCKPLVEERSDSTFAFIHVYLQSPDSIMVLDRADVLRHHGLTIATCLLSSLQVYVPTCLSHTRLSRTLNGIHGFHNYAAEHWADCLLSIVKDYDNTWEDSEFFF